MKPTSVLFVCLGNICRSPTAEGVFRSLVTEAGLADRFVIDSAGTGDWHVGKPPDRRATAEAARRGIDISGLRARQVTPEDFVRFDHILAMDRSNLQDLRRLGRAGAADPVLFLDYAADTDLKDVPDPYLEGGFDRTFDLIRSGAHGLLRSIAEND